MAAAARELGMSKQTLWMRLQRMPPEDALRDKEGRRVVFTRKSSRFVIVDGSPITTAQCAKHFGVTIDTVYRWIRTGKLEIYGKRKNVFCAHCGKPDHRFSTCPDLYLKHGGRRARAAPPPDSELRAAGILPKDQVGKDWL